MMEGVQNPALDPVIYPSRFTFHKRSPAYYIITDNKNNILFKVKPFHSRYRQQLVLIGADNIIKLRLRKQFWFGHGHRWNAYNGVSKANSDLLFRIKKTHSKTVSLAANKQNGDLKIKGNWPATSCSIYMGDCLMAQMKRMEFIKDKFSVTIYPNVDVASMVSVFAIIDFMSIPLIDDENYYRHNNYERVFDETHLAQAFADGDGVAEGVPQGLSEFISFFQE